MPGGDPESGLGTRMETSASASNAKGRSRNTLQRIVLTWQRAPKPDGSTVLNMRHVVVNLNERFARKQVLFEFNNENDARRLSFHWQAALFGSGA